MDTGSRIKLVREHRGLTQQKLGEMLGYGKSSANRIAQYEMGYRSPKANRLKEIAKAMNIREEIFPYAGRDTNRPASNFDMVRLGT